MFAIILNKLFIFVMINLQTLKKYFLTADLPETLVIREKRYNNVRLAVDMYINYLEKNPKNIGYLPYYQHLLEIYNHELSKTTTPRL